MHSADKISVFCVPPTMLGEVWPYAGEWVLRGLSVAPERGALETLDAIRSGEIQLWVICQSDPNIVLGTCLTQLVEHSSARVVAAYAMAGRDWRCWADKLCDEIVKFAKAEGRSGVRFAGRKGWMKAFERIKLVGHLPSGEALFERAVQ